MKKESSCVAVFSEMAEANNAIQHIITMGIDKNHVSLIGETIQQGKVAADGLEYFDSDLLQLGIHKANLYCYKALIYSGSYLVVVNGSHTVVEQAYKHLEQYTGADVAIHFNSA